MRKKKSKKIVRRFKYLNDDRKNILFNFRNNIKVKGGYLTMRYVYLSAFIGNRKREECLAIPVRYKNKFIIGDIVLFDQTAKYRLKFFKQFIDNSKPKRYFKIFAINTQETWDGLVPYFVLFLDVKELNNLEFLAAMNDLKKREKNR